MAGPYDYTINIPQPPAQNFLQNLLGIQQLRQMQEQGAMQQQQSAIQQQQAQFAQQMQPLQLQAERARIGQIGQATASAAEALRQGKITFEQGQQDRVRQMEQQAVAQAKQNELFGRLNSLPADAPMSDIVPIANELAVLKPELSKQVMANFSALPEQFQNASKTALITATTQLEAGDVEGAKKTYQTFEQAIRNSGGNNPQLNALADGVKAQAMILDYKPNVGKLAAFEMLSAIDTKTADSIVGMQEKVATGKVVDEEKRAVDLEKERAQTEEIKARTKKLLGEVAVSEKPLPSSIIRENQAIDKKVASANDMADKLAQASEAMRQLPSVGAAKEWWTNVKPKLGFGENPEIAVRTNAAQLAGLGILGSESSAMGGAIRSNVQFQYATSKLPDAWSSPQALADRLNAQAEVQRKLAQLMTIDSEWNSAFRGSQKATKDEQILGMDVAPGMTKTKFKEMAAQQLFPPSNPNLPPVSARNPATGAPLSAGSIDLGGGNTATFKLRK